ncbi:MAG: ABC transporter ATP-binding protein [Ignisphaera sp.]|uniref:ABC transporter ATP-binding protein n=1 Tax=Ignisphaera aggregans TaxID=334771 RepID=A0A7J3N0S9_9CREN
MSLCTVDLFAGYGKLKVLFGINIAAVPNGITAIVGPNGAGKSTLLNSIYGLADVYNGKIIFDGIDITYLKPYKRAHLGISYVPQMGNIFAELTVYENLLLAGYQMDRNELRDRISWVLDAFPRLKEFLNRKAGTLSGGERRMLAIAMGLMKKPKIMLLDEVTTDLAPIIVKKVLDIIVELRDKLKLTIVLVEQYAKRALEISDKAYLLVSGKIRYEGSPKDLLENEEFAKLYLGL